MDQLIHNQTQDQSAAHPLPAECADCGAPLSGPFCSQCGEHVIDRHSLTLWHFINHNLLHEFSHVDGKIFRTFRYLLFRPGFLSAEYFAGHRRRYINPVRLLLTCLVVFALLPNPDTMTMNIYKVPLRLNLLPPGTPSSHNISDTLNKLDVLGILEQMKEEKGRHKDLEAESSVEKFNHELKTYGTALSFCNVILLAAFLALLYYKRRPLFVEHLVFSLHIAAFVILFSTLPRPLFSVIIKLTHGKATIVGGGILAISLVTLEITYLYKALLRFYRSDVADTMRWWSAPAWITRLAVLAIFIANSFFITFTYAAGAAIALWRV
jgi:hypothetical protein